MKDEEIKKEVKRAYSQRAEKIAKTGSSVSCCIPNVSQCCPSSAQTLNKLGYSAEEIRNIPEKVINLSAGCGNPISFSELKTGEIVLDLGSGSGIDVFLAARKVGEDGRVIGVDFSEKMVDIARRNAVKMNVRNVKFRLGDLENLPVKNTSVDVVISNCVVNLVLDKEKVFKEAYRVLKPGGRMIISDIVTDKRLPSSVRNDLVLWISCVGGALPEQEYLEAVEKVGFKEVSVAERGMSVEGEFRGVKVYHIIAKARKS